MSLSTKLISLFLLILLLSGCSRKKTIGKEEVKGGDLQDFMGTIWVYDNGKFKMHYNGIIIGKNCWGKYRIVEDTIELKGCSVWAESFDTIHIDGKGYVVKALP